MKKITLANYATDTYYPKIVKAVDSALQSENFVSPIRIFIGMGLLGQPDVDEWRKGRVPYLEKVIKCNLAKASRILRILRMHAHDLKLKPSVTVYKRKNKGRKIPLQFSKSGKKISKRRIRGILLSWVRQALTRRSTRTLRPLRGRVAGASRS
jgi:hypothetical protein